MLPARPPLRLSATDAQRPQARPASTWATDERTAPVGHARTATSEAVMWWDSCGYAPASASGASRYRSRWSARPPGSSQGRGEPVTIDQEPLDSPQGWVADHVRRYITTDGADGHLWRGAPTLVLTTLGRRSGRPRRLALIYGQDGVWRQGKAPTGGD